jgi:hypothetical protein
MPDDGSSFLKSMGAEGAALAEILKELGEYVGGNLTLAFKDFQNVATNTLTALDKQLSVNEGLVSSYKSLVKSSQVLEQRNKQINKAFGVGVTQAARLSQTFQDVARQLGISGEQTAKYGGSIRKMLPTLNQLNASSNQMYIGMQQTQHILQTNIGLTEEQSNAYTQFAAANGESASTMLKATQAMAKSLDPDGTMGYFKTITEGISGAGAEIQLQFGKMPGSLELAVLKAARLGLELDDLKATSEKFLEIESSIGEELEYQLLSGHRLVDNQGNSLTNLYREAALRGDMNKQADVLNNILENEGDVLENNLFARKQMATMLGMEENQLASALQKKKILDKAAAEGVEINLDGTDALAQAAAAVEAGAITPDDFEKLKEATDTRTSEEILDQILTVLTEQMMLDTLMFNQAALTNENQQAILKNGPGMLSGLMMGLSESALATAGKMLTSKQTINKAGENIEGTWDKLFGTDNEGSTFTSTMGSNKELTTKMDAVIPPGFGSRILSFPEDTLQAPIAFSDNDTIVAGTNLAGKGGGGADMSAVIAELRNQTMALIAAMKSSTTFSGGGLNAPYYG